MPSSEPVPRDPFQFFGHARADESGDHSQPKGLPMPEKFVKLSDELADFIGAARGSQVSDQHGSFVGANHTQVVVEDGEVKIVSFPGGTDVPAKFRAKNFGSGPKANQPGAPPTATPQPPPGSTTLADLGAITPRVAAAFRELITAIKSDMA